MIAAVLALLILGSPTAPGPASPATTTATTARPLVGSEVGLYRDLEDALREADHAREDADFWKARASRLEYSRGRLRRELITATAPPPARSELWRDVELVAGAAGGAALGAGGCAIAGCEIRGAAVVSALGAAAAVLVVLFAH